MLYKQDSCGVPAATKGVPAPAPLEIVFFIGRTSHSGIEYLT
jgi:hypothetical protein